MNSDISTVCNDDYDTRILRALRKIIRAVDIHSRKLNKEFKITTPQLICLHSLRDSGPMTLSQLANDVSLGTSTTTGIVDRLVTKQFVTRTRSEQDRRKISLVITEAGQKLIELAPRCYSSSSRRPCRNCLNQSRRLSRFRLKMWFR